MFKFLVLFLSFIFFLTSCAGVKQGLTGSKKNNKDEFLVQKKNPLVLPPNFNDLPQPGLKEEVNIRSNENSQVKKLLEEYSVDSDQNNNNKVQSIEESVLEKIKAN